MDREECKFKQLVTSKFFVKIYTVGGKMHDCHCYEFKGCNKKSIQ